jgi:hypothetical protein
VSSPPPDDGLREWLSFEDPEEHRTWLFDVTFLTSPWSCLYGRGCPGIEEEPAPERALGCCTHGAYLSDADDLEHVRACMELLGPDTWQLQHRADELGGALWQDEEGWWRTRVVDGACVFQNRPDHPGGAGCAFHQFALAVGRPPLELKPEICWQVPIRREDHETSTGHIYTMVREWHRRDWGGEDPDVWWWCTEAPEAHIGTRPVYRELDLELRAICGDSIHRWLVGELDERWGGGVLVPHPTVRRGPGRSTG